MQKLIDDVLNLIFPRSCLLCGIPDADLCGRCKSEIRADWQRVDGGAIYLTTPAEPAADVSLPQDLHPQLGKVRNGEILTAIFPVYSPNRYRGSVKEIVVKWKHSNIADFEQQALAIWCTQIAELQQILCAAQADLKLLFPKLNPAGSELLIVNAPSGFRRRFDNQLIAWKLSCGLAKFLLRNRLKHFGKNSRSNSCWRNCGHRFHFCLGKQLILRRAIGKRKELNRLLTCTENK
ncbi:hypothetical protein RQN30_04520 [Arcanobacterium hippocoleae]